MGVVELYHKLSDILARGESAAIATIIGGEGSTPRKVGAKMLITASGDTFGTIGGGIIEAEVIRIASSVIRMRRLQIVDFDLNKIRDPDTDMRCGGKMSVLIEPVIPPDPVIIFGGGHVGFAIYSVLSMIDFGITVVDDRRIYATKKRFPKAKRIICAPYEKSFEKVKIDKNTYIIICTRAHKADEECLRFALKTPACYVGMLGSKTKVASFKKKMRAAGISQKRIRELYAPIGLDIGAVTPEEIAISVAAELIQFRINRLQYPL